MPSSGLAVTVARAIKASLDTEDVDVAPQRKMRRSTSSACGGLYLKVLYVLH